MKIILEFSNLQEMADWAKELVENPAGAVEELAGEEKTKKKETGLAKVKEEAEPEPEPGPKKQTEKAGKGVSEMLTSLKEAGVELTEMKPTRYEGVQLALAKYGVSKIGELEEDDQPKVLKMFKKMAAASKTEFAEMLDYLK